MKPSHLTALAALALVCGFTIAAPTVAAADPSAPAGPLLDTTCSFGQIDAALRYAAPEFARRLDEQPDRKAKLQAFFELPVDQRHAELDRFLGEHPILEDRRDEIANSPRAEEFRAKVAEIADTCHNY